MKRTFDFRPVWSRFSWLQFGLNNVLFLFLTLLPPLALGGMDTIIHTGPYAIWFFLYMVLAAFLFCLLTAYQKYHAFDRPMQLLGEAAKRVASGDFSVRLDPLYPHKPENDVDAMFRDFSKMAEGLASLDIMKNDFIANVSHEFKTPLAVIQNCAAELQDEALDTHTRQEYLATIQQTASNMVGLVTNILRLNKINSQTISVNSRPYDLCAQLCNCVAGFSEQLDEKYLDFEADMEDEAILSADSEMLSLVWNNLLSNAIKFTEPGGRIHLAEKSDGGTVTVTVEDNGCGIEETAVPHIFEKFYQADSSHSKEGNGLGLALAYRVVKLFGGGITVESKPGQGSAFTVTLPRNL